MCFNKKKLHRSKYAWVIVFSLFSFIAQAKSTKELTVTPKQCIALHKGQMCYLDVTFQWRQPKKDNYCLVNTTTNSTVKCWQDSSNSTLEYDFKAQKSHLFALRIAHSTENIAIASIPVVWVYKSKRRTKSSWRLF